MSYYTTKPPYGAKINRGHPLVQMGMQGFYTINEGGGGILYDALGQLNLTATGFGATNPWGAGSQGGVKCNVNGEGYQSQLPSRLQFTANYAMAIGFRCLGAPTPGSILSGTSYDNTSAVTPFYAAAIDYASIFRHAYSSGGSLTILSSTISASVGTDFVISIGSTPTQKTIFVNGTLSASSSGSYTSPSFTTTSQVAFGNNPGLSRTANFVAYWFAWWNTALPASVHAQIGSNINAIWQVFPKQNSMIYSPPTIVTMPAMAWCSQP